MTNIHPTKISTARRKGDEYELHLLALKCLQMLVEPKILQVFHEYRPALPADDVVVETTERIDCYQAKHANNPHALLDFDDIVSDTDLRLNIQRLITAWASLKSSGKDIYIHIFTNRAAGSELAKILDNDQVAASVLENEDQKRLRARLKSASGISEEDEFKDFLRTLRFDLRQPDLDALRQHIQQEWLEKRLGLNPADAYSRLIFNVENWWLESYARPIKRDEVVKALQIDSGTLQQIFDVDLRTYVAHPDFERQLDELLTQIQTGYVAIVGPPGSGKSTFLTRYIEKYERKNRQPIIRYYCFIEVNDPLFRQRVSSTGFLISMIEQLWRQFSRVLPQERRYDYSPERFHQLLDYLGQHFSGQNQRLLMVVDGVDHARRANIEETRNLLNVLPASLPQGIVCLIGTQGTHHLPAPVARQCRGNRLLNLPLFNPLQTTTYLRRQPQLHGLLTSHRAEIIHQRSEGLPLYLRYITEQLSAPLSDDIDNTISTFPIHGGHIDNYHGQLWDEVGQDSPLQHLLGLVTRLRFRVQETDLIYMVGLEAFAGEEALRKIRHLFDVTEAGVRIYHNSFREFVQNELTTEQLRQLDVEILDYLNARRGSPAWFAHAFEYAMSAQSYSFLIETLTADYIEEAIGLGRPRSEIIAAIRYGAKAALELADPVAMARVATLFSHTDNRLEHHIDRRQLQRTRFALDDPEAALAAISYQGVVYDTSQATAEALLDLAEFGYTSAGQKLTQSFFELLPDQLDTVDQIHGAGELLAVYGHSPAEYLARFICNSDVLLLRKVLHHLYRFDRYEVIRTLKKLLLAMPDGEEWREEWTFQITLLEARVRPETAEHHFRWAEHQVKNDDKRIWLAGAAALTNCDEDLVLTLLGHATFLPDLQNRSVIYSRGSEEFQKFRAYIAALAYCNRHDELETLRDYLTNDTNWLATYYLANLDMMIAYTQFTLGNDAAPVELLLPLDQLIDHQRNEGERIYEVFDAICKDLPTFLEMVIDAYVAAGGDEEQLFNRLQRWGNSELIRTPYGVRLAIANFKDEMVALQIASKYSHLRPELRPLLLALREKIVHSTYETETRTNHLLKLAETAAINGNKSLAHNWLMEGLQASNGYGYRKDTTLSMLIDAVEVVNQIGAHNAPGRFADIVAWNSWMHRVTDGAATKWFAHYLFHAVLEYDYDIALRMLLTYRYSIERWKFSDCLAELLEIYRGTNPQLAYVLSEVINECVHENGFEDKFKARHQLLKLAVERGDTETAVWIAGRLRQFIQCEVSPDRRDPLIRDYNQLAASHSLPVISGTPSSEGEAPLARVFQLDEQSLSVTELVEQMSQSVDDFEQVSTKLQETNQFVDFLKQAEEAVDYLLSHAGSIAELDRIAQAMTKTRIFEADTQLKLAQAYRRLGDHDRYISSCQQAFETLHSWSLGDKRVEYLAPLIENDPNEALKFVLQVIYNAIKRYDTGFGASTLLVRTLSMFGDGYQDMVLRIYEEFHHFVGQQFANLPEPGASPYEWLREETIVHSTFEDFALELIFDEWKEPAIHRRIALTHLLDDLTISQFELLMPRLVSLLTHEIGTLRVQSALVLNSVALQRPDLLSPYVNVIADALDNPHIEVTQYLITTLRQIKNLIDLPSETQNRLNSLYPDTPRQEVLIPSGSIQPSIRFRERVLQRAMKSVIKMIEDVCKVIGLDIDRVYWRVERQMYEMGYDEMLAEDEDRRRGGAYVHPQGSHEGFIPFETHTTDWLRHCFAEVIDRITREQVFPPEVIETLYRRVRMYDPCLPWQHTYPKPDDLFLPQLSNSVGESEIPSEVEPWLQFEDTSEFEVVTSPQRWIPILDLFSHSSGRLYEHCVLISHLVSDSLANEIEAGKSDLGKFESIRRLARKPPFFTLTIQEAQYLLQTSRFSENPTLAPQIPLISVDSGHWWYSKEYDLAGLVGTWIEHFSLTWKSSDRLDMQKNGTDVVHYIHWENGYLADTFQYENVGEGTRLSISREFLQVLTSEFNLHLLVTQYVARTIRRPRYATDGTDEKRENEAVKLIKIDG